jgi:hypothetical protein
LATGDASKVSRAQLWQRFQQDVAAQQAHFASAKQQLFGLSATGAATPDSLLGIDWQPGQFTIHLRNLDQSASMAVLPANWTYSSNTAVSNWGQLAYVGSDAQAGARYAVFGGDPFLTPGNAAMDKLMVNTVTWLSKRSGMSGLNGLKVVVAQMPNGAESKLRTWLASKAGTLTINGVSSNPASQSNDSCDNAKLDACLQGAELLVIGHDQGAGYNGDVVMQAVRAAQARGVGVLYVHSSWGTSDLTQRLLASYRLADANPGAGNYFHQLALKAFAPTALPALPNQLPGWSGLLKRLEDGSFSTNWNGCTGGISCSEPSFVAEFGDPANTLSATLREHDTASRALFASTGYGIEKLMVLIGDKYRAEVAYANTFTKESNRLGFFRALYADAASYMTRGHGTVAQNLGTFSPLFTAPTATRSASVAPPATGWLAHATGIYIMPGRSVTITRTDAGSTKVSFGINMLRNSTQAFERLDRPTQLGSPRPQLLPNVPVTITSPNGGPLYLFLEAGSGQPTVNVQVTNASTHPVLRDARNPTAVASFLAELNSTPTNWVVMSLDMVMLHSNKPKFQSSVSLYKGDLAKLANDSWTFYVKGLHELAGYRSNAGAFSLPPEVSAFCQSAGWDCSGNQHLRDQIQHVIADEIALCGSACSGNPYDQSSPFNPLGWTESHEVGHNIQPERLKIYTSKSREISNNLFPIHKFMAYNRAQGSELLKARESLDCPTRMSVTACMFNLLKAAQAKPDPTAAAYDAIWKDTNPYANNSERIAFYRQLVEYARHYNRNLRDGWELLTLMYLLERNVGASSANWTSVNTRLGFGTYATYPNTMNGNDFVLIAASNVARRDLRPVFDLWGVVYSDAASAQVQAFGFQPAAQVVFPMAHLSAQSSGVGAPVPVNATSVYPAGY